MFSKNLKYYRLKNKYTKASLAARIGVTPMAITNYESGVRKPDMATIKELSKALNVKVADFLTERNGDLVFSHGEFRKNSRLSKGQQEYVCEAVEEYFNRFYEAVEILGGEVFFETPEMHAISFSEDTEEDGRRLRRYLTLPEHGPVGNLTETLENHGILVCFLEFEDEGFSGLNGSINNRPYIVVNKNMTAERIRTTIGHELAHFAFDWPQEMSDKECEKYATAIAGAFLFPEDDAKRELGIRRKSITTDMYIVCKEYGIAMSMLAVRAHSCDIINEKVYRAYFMRLHAGKESSRIKTEEPVLFEQLVYRAVNEEEISIQKGAELLKLPYDTVAENCRYAGG